MKDEGRIRDTPLGDFIEGREGKDDGGDEAIRGMGKGGGGGGEMKGGGKG